MKKANIFRVMVVLLFIVFITVSWIADFNPGKDISGNLASFGLEMLKILPCVFILVGLFEVWVKSETIEKHLGEGSGIKGYLWGLLLAGTTIGGLYITFPIAYSLYNKGARIGVIFTYISASVLCRIPMAIFEASFLGIKFTLIRLLVSLPLVIVTSMLLGNYLTKRGYKITEGR